MVPTRRALMFAAAASFLAGRPAAAAPSMQADDIGLGNPKATVEVIEFASLSCPHCAHFNEVVFAPFKAKWVDTGKVHYVLKEMLTEPANVAAAGFLLARCAGAANYYK